MTQRQVVKNSLIAGLVFVSLGGWILHYNIHPVSEESANYLPLIIGFLSIIVVPLLFCFKSTIHYGYVLNGMTVIFGTVLMAHFSLAHWPHPFTVFTLFFKTLLPDVMILFSKFFLGKVLFDIMIFGSDPAQKRIGKWYRYPGMGWWTIHLAGISAVYAIGILIWR